MAMPLDWDAIADLLRWKHRTKVLENASSMIDTCATILSRPCSSQTVPKNGHKAPSKRLDPEGPADTFDGKLQFPALELIKKRFNLPKAWILKEMLSFLLLVLTKSQKNSTLSDPKGAHEAKLKQLFHLLHVLLRLHHQESIVHEIVIPASTCNLILDGIATLIGSSTFETHAKPDDTHWFNDANALFLYLFGMEIHVTDKRKFHVLQEPRFGMFKPQPNQFLSFMQRAIPSLLQTLQPTPTKPCELSATMQQRIKIFVFGMLQVFHALQQGQLNKKKVFLMVAKSHLPTFLTFRQAIHRLCHPQSIVESSQQQDDPLLLGAIEELLNAIMMDAIFEKEHFAEFEQALVHGKRWLPHKEQDEANQATTTTPTTTQPSKKKQKQQRGNSSTDTNKLVSFQRQLFEELVIFLSNSEVSWIQKQHVGDFFKHLVNVYTREIRKSHDQHQPTTFKGRKRTSYGHVLAGNSNGMASPFRFWVECCSVVVLAYDQLVSTHQGSHAESPAADENAPLEMVLCLFDALFESLALEDVYRITEDDADQSHFQQLEAIWRRLWKLLRTHSESSRIAGVVWKKSILDHQVAILQNAAKCSPKLLQVDLEVALTVFARQTLQCSCETSSSASTASIALTTIASSVVCMVEAFESMRLLDTLLTALFATHDDATARGLLMLLAGDSSCEHAWRHCFGSMLSMSSIELRWTLFMDQLDVLVTTQQSQKSKSTTNRVALVRVLFGLFVEEIQVNSSNRVKLQQLVMSTFEKVFGISSASGSKNKAAAAAASNWLSTVENAFEMWSLYGQLLVFYREVDAKTRDQVFDAFLLANAPESMEKDTNQVVETWKQYLDSGSRRLVPCSQTDQKSKTTALVCSGVLQLLLHLVRQQVVSQHQQQPIGVATSLASAVCKFVIENRAWRLIAFRLPDLVDCLTRTQCTELLLAMWSNALADKHDEALGMIVNDAALYELGPFQQAAPLVLTRLAWQSLLSCWQASTSTSKWLSTLTKQINTTTDIVVSDDQWCALLKTIQKESHLAVKPLAQHDALFEFVQSIPSGFLVQPSNGMINVLCIAVCQQSLYLSRGNQEPAALPALHSFIETAFSSMVYETDCREDSLWSQWLSLSLEQTLVNACEVSEIMHVVAPQHKCLCHVLRVVLHHSKAGNSLTQVVQQQLDKVIRCFREKPSKWFRCVVFLWTILLEATSTKATLVHQTIRETSPAQEFIQQTLQIALENDLLQTNSMMNSQKLKIATALLKMLVQNDGIVDGAHGQQVRQQIVESLVVAMQTLCVQSHVQDEAIADVTGAAWSFFVAFCADGIHVPALASCLEEHASDARSSLKTFGRLLAAAFVGLTCHTQYQSNAQETLESLVAFASRQQEEFELLIQTILTEINCSQPKRVVAALTALRMVFDKAERRQLALARREVLSNAKHKLVAVLGEVLRNLVIQKELVNKPQGQVIDKGSLPVCSLIMQNLVFLFCKPEFFSWKSNDLVMIFSCLEPLQVIATLNPRQWIIPSLARQELDQIWCSSYALLLRVVRQLFQPLGLASNGSSVFFIVNGTNALLQVLLKCSSVTLQEDDHMLLTWSSNLARLFGYMKDHNGTFRKHVVYLLIQFVVAATKGQLPMHLQQRLRPGVFALMDICSEHERDQLFACLDATGKTFLKSLDTTYKLTHRFVGKV